MSDPVEAAWEALQVALRDTHYNRTVLDVHRSIIEAAIRSESAGTGLDDPKFRAAVDAVFAAPGEFGPAKGYYGEATDHFIDMLKAEYARLSSSDTEREVGS